MSNNITKNGESEGQPRANYGEDVAWLAGLFDGEGCLGLWMDKRSMKSCRSHLIIGNCNLDLLFKARDVIQAITHKKYHITCSEKRGMKAGQGFRKHDFFALQIYDQKGMRKICEAMLPHLTAKRRQAQLIIEFCLLRQTKKHTYNSPYGQEELDIIKNLNEARTASYGESHRGVETKRDAPEKGDAIVH